MKILITFVFAGLFLLFISLMVISGIAYSKDVVPTLSVSEPLTNMTIKNDQVIIRGTYEPKNRKVWINGKQITATGGVFETTYELNEGENKIDISAGDWKRVYVNLVVNRELSDADKASNLSLSTTMQPTVEQKATVRTTTAIPTITVTKTLPTTTETSEPLPTRAYTIQTFPAQFEHYLNDVWDEMPGTSYKVYWWDTWEGVDSGYTHLVIEPKFTPSDWQCNRIAQVTAFGRNNLLGRKDGVIHVVKFDNSGDYCSLRSP